MWAKFKGGDDADEKWPGYLYYAGHGVSALAAVLAITGYVMYKRKQTSGESNRTSGTTPRFTPLFSVDRGGAVLGVGGTY